MVVGVYQVTKDNVERLTKFTKLNIDFMNGMTVTVKHKDFNERCHYEVYKKDDSSYIIRECSEKKKDLNYILGVEKFPLSDTKYGLLSKKLDILFNTNSVYAIDKGRLKENKSLILRRGCYQDSKNSFLSVAASLQSIS